MKVTSLLSGLLAGASLVASLPTPKDSLQSVFQRSETGPVISANFPDPTVINVSDTWYAFATRTIGSNTHIQIASSPDFNTWTVASEDALPTLPAWVNQTNWATWAPSVVQLSTNSFIMYFSAVTTESSTGLYHCIGAATASSVTGPYTAQASSLICPLSQGGAIDPSGWQGPAGQRWIVYKVDGNSLGNGGACGNTVAPIVPTPIQLQAVADDGLTLQGSPITLLNNDGAADQGIIEAPSVAYDSASELFLLFFSSGCFVEDSYTVSYATATSPEGPYTRQATPLFSTGVDGLTAPGSATIWSDAQHMVFHANYGSGRAMYTAEISVTNGVVSA